MEPLEVDNSQEEVEEGGDDDEDGQLPGQPGQQVDGFLLLGERPNVVTEEQVPFVLRTGTPLKITDPDFKIFFKTV